MRVLLVSRIDNRDALAFTGEIRTLLTGRGCDVILDRDTASSLGHGGIPLAGADADVVIVVGGDGTILRTIQQMNRPSRSLASTGAGSDSLRISNPLKPSRSSEHCLRVFPLRNGCVSRSIKTGTVSVLP